MGGPWIPTIVPITPAAPPPANRATRVGRTRNPATLRAIASSTSMAKTLLRSLSTDHAESDSAKDGTSRKAKQREAETLASTACRSRQAEASASKEPASNMGPGTSRGSRSASSGTASRARPMPTDAWSADAIDIIAFAAITVTAVNQAQTWAPLSSWSLTLALVGRGKRRADGSNIIPLVLTKMVYALPSCPCGRCRRGWTRPATARTWRGPASQIAPADSTLHPMARQKARV